MHVRYDKSVADFVFAVVIHVSLSRSIGLHKLSIILHYRHTGYLLCSAVNRLLPIAGGTGFDLRERILHKRKDVDLSLQVRCVMMRTR